MRPPDRAMNSWRHAGPGAGVWLHMKRRGIDLHFAIEAGLRDFVRELIREEATQFARGAARAREPVATKWPTGAGRAPDGWAGRERAPGHSGHSEDLDPVGRAAREPTRKWRAAGTHVSH